MALTFKFAVVSKLPLCTFAKTELSGPAVRALALSVHVASGASFPMILAVNSRSTILTMTFLGTIRSPLVLGTLFLATFSHVT